MRFVNVWEETWSRNMNSVCKGPEAGASPAPWRVGREAAVAGAEWTAPGREGDRWGHAGP